MGNCRHWPEASNGEALRNIRQYIAWTQAAMADYLGVTRNTVARWERGELGMRNPKLIFQALDALLLERGDNIRS